MLGRLTWLRNILFSRRPQAPSAIRRRFLGVAVLISAVMPNTAVVGALMGPAMRNPRIAPRQLLLPLSYAALAGGMVTHFGPSANLITVGQAARQGVEIGFLDFLLPGTVTALAVYVALLLAAPRLMEAANGMSAPSAPELFHVEGRVVEGSPLIGRSLTENHLRSLGHFYVAELIRGDALLSPARPDEILQAGDVLIFVGDVRFLDELTAIPGVAVMEEVRERSGLQVHHAVLAQDSALAGRTLKSSNFRAAFSASVFAIRRGDERLSGKLGEVELKPGDLLAIAGGSQSHLLPSPDVALRRAFESGEVRLVTGHHQFGVHRLLRTPCSYFTFVIVINKFKNKFDSRYVGGWSLSSRAIGNNNDNTSSYSSIQ